MSPKPTFKVTVAARGTHHKDSKVLRFRSGIAFGRDPQEVDVTLEKYVPIAEDKHLIVLKGPPLAEAKVELERIQKAEKAAAAANQDPKATVNFTDRDDVERALRQHTERAQVLREQNEQLHADLETIHAKHAATHEKLDQLLERLAKLEAGAAATPATTPGNETKPVGDQGKQQKK